jgi:hypothetical protein
MDKVFNLILITTAYIKDFFTPNRPILHKKKNEQSISPARTSFIMNCVGSQPLFHVIRTRNCLVCVGTG